SEFLRIDKDRSKDRRDRSPRGLPMNHRLLKIAVVLLVVLRAHVIATAHVSASDAPPNAGQRSQWVAVRPPDEEFSAELPEGFSVDEDSSVPHSITRTYTASSEGFFFSIEASRPPFVIMSTKEVMTTAAESTHSAMAKRLESVGAEVEFVFERNLSLN